MDEIKTAVEKVCPEVVSCSDVLVIAARAAVSLVSATFDTNSCSPSFATFNFLQSY